MARDTWELFKEAPGAYEVTFPRAVDRRCDRHVFIGGPSWEERSIHRSDSMKARHRRRRYLKAMQRPSEEE